jgi:hypothetical protein
MHMDHTNVINSFEDVWMIDPDDSSSSLKRIKHKIESLDFEVDTYPKSIM